jgi:general secretion pathway protein N
MVRWPKYAGLALLAGAALSCGPASQPRAATSSTIDILSNDHVGDTADTVDVGSMKPLARPNRESVRVPPSGNPLWAVPLSALGATQARPIFSASRRPPQQAVIAPTAEAAPPPAAPSEPDRPALALIGAVVGDSDAIAVFLDRATQKTVRLRQGDSHAGWQLSAVQAREVTFMKSGRSEVLALQRQDGSAVSPPALAPSAPLAPAPQPVAGAFDGSYAPFTPRSTPKNGESDGL